MEKLSHPEWHYLAQLIAIKIALP